MEFTRTKYSGLDLKTKVCFEADNNAENPFKITADQQGLVIGSKDEKLVVTEKEQLETLELKIGETWLGLKLNDQRDAETLARHLALAWGEHRKLVPKISR